MITLPPARKGRYIACRTDKEAIPIAWEGWRLVVGGWWLVVGGWWLVAGGWWLVVGTSIRGPKMEVLAAIIALSTDCGGFISSCKMVTIGDCMGLYHCIKLFK
jgi:hypothetical protein